MIDDDIGKAMMTRLEADIPMPAASLICSQREAIKRAAVKLVRDMEHRMDLRFRRERRELMREQQEEAK